MPSDDEFNEGGGGVDPGQKQCPHCSFVYPDSKKGSGQFLAHFRKEHPDKTKRGLAAAAEQAKETAISQSMTPLGERFRDVITRVGINQKGIVETLCNLFNRNSAVLSKDRHRLRAWLSRYGVMTEQISQVEDEMFGLEGIGPEPGVPGQGQQVSYIPGPNGQMTPVIIVNPSQPQQPALGQPSMPFYQPMPGWGASVPASAGNAALEEKIEEMAASIATLVAAMQAPAPPAAPGHPMRRVPIIGEDGNVLVDASGRTIMQEVPYDPMMGTLEMMKAVSAMFRPAGPVFDEEKLLLKIDAKLTATAAATPAAPAAIELPAEVKETINRLSVDLSEMKKDKEISVAIHAAVEPLKAQIASLGNSQAGLTDRQSELVHAEKITGLYGEFLDRGVTNFRDEIRPLIIQSTISTMRANGVSDETINKVVESLGSSRVPSAVREKISAMESKWVRST